MNSNSEKIVLVADDDPVMIKLFQFNLSKAGFRVISCNDGDDVVNVALRENPSVALLDYLLPGRTGLELISDFKEIPELAALPTIIVTGQGKGSLRDELMRAGAKEVFTKPFSPSLLIEAIERQTPAQSEISTQRK